MGQAENQYQAREQDYGQDCNLPQVCHRKVPHQPENDVMKATVLGHGDEKHDDGRAKGIDHHAGKQQRFLF